MLEHACIEPDSEHLYHCIPGTIKMYFFSMLEDYRKNNIMLKNAFCSDFLLIPYPKYV